jgi:hypothetical protein
MSKLDLSKEGIEKMLKNQKEESEKRLQAIRDSKESDTPMTTEEMTGIVSRISTRVKGRIDSIALRCMVNSAEPLEHFDLAPETIDPEMNKKRQGMPARHTRHMMSLLEYVDGQCHEFEGLIKVFYLTFDDDPMTRYVMSEQIRWIQGHLGAAKADVASMFHDICVSRQYTSGTTIPAIIGSAIIAKCNDYLDPIGRFCGAYTGHVNDWPTEAIDYGHWNSYLYEDTRFSLSGRKRRKKPEGEK